LQAVVYETRYFVRARLETDSALRKFPDIVNGFHDLIQRDLSGLPSE
jgi:hypothetical protein